MSNAEQIVINNSDVQVLDAKSKTPITDKLKQELEIRVFELQERLKPYREYHDQHVNDPRYLEAKKQIKEVNLLLGPIQNELAALARVRGAKGIKLEPGHYNKS